jgi:hypothetical protein
VSCSVQLLEWLRAMDGTCTKAALRRSLSRIWPSTLTGSAPAADTYHAGVRRGRNACGTPPGAAAVVVCHKQQLSMFYQELQLTFRFEEKDHGVYQGAGCPTRAVHLVDEGEAGDAVPPHLPVHRDGLALHPAHCAQHQHRAVQHPQRPLHLQCSGFTRAVTFYQRLQRPARL